MTRIVSIFKNFLNVSKILFLIANQSKFFNNKTITLIELKVIRTKSLQEYLVHLNIIKIISFVSS